MDILSQLYRFRQFVPSAIKRRIRSSSFFYTHLKETVRRESGTLRSIEAVVRSLERVPLSTFLHDVRVHGAGRSAAPHRATIEINNTCNLDCAMCRTSQSKRPKGAMDLSLFETVLRKLKAHNIQLFTIHTIGEPLANKHLAEYLKIIRRQGLSIAFLSSNCLLMKHHMDTLFEFRDVISSIRPSIDAASKEVYEKIRRGARWDVLNDALTEFAYRNGKLKTPFPVYVHNVISQDNVHEIAFIPEVFSYLTPPTNFAFSFISALAPTKEYFIEQSCLDDVYAVNIPCEWVMGERTFVLRDGSLSTCCRDYDGRLVYGDISNDCLETVFANQFMSRLRQAMSNEDFESIPDVCKSCFVVDPRLSDIIDKTFQFFFSRVKKDSIHLQKAVNEIVSRMKRGEFRAILDILKSL